MDSDELKKKKARYVVLTRKADAHEKMSDADNAELAKLENLKQSSKKKDPNAFSYINKTLAKLFSKKREDSKKKKPKPKEHEAGLGGIGKYVKSGGKY